MEIDVWNGEPENETGEENGNSSDSSSESSSDEDEKKTKKPRKTKAEKQEAKKAKATTSTSRRSRINNAVNSKLDGMLHRKSEVSTEPETNDVSNDHAEPAGEPAAEGAAPVRVPSRPEPVVLHGHTLTKGATFRDVCNAIRDNAFVTSDLPVIVSLEVHACLEQQQIMVEIMQESWNGLLINITPELIDSPQMPTLEDLKKKILIKVKWVPHLGDDHAEAETAEELKSLEVHKQKTAQGGSSGTAPPKPSKILEALSRLAVYTKGFSFKGMNQPGMTLSTTQNWMN